MKKTTPPPMSEFAAQRYWHLWAYFPQWFARLEAAGTTAADCEKAAAAYVDAVKKGEESGLYRNEINEYALPMFILPTPSYEAFDAYEARMDAEDDEPPASGRETASLFPDFTGAEG